MPEKNNSLETPETEKINTRELSGDYGSWYLVRLMSKRRNSFLKQLEITIAKNKLQDLFLEMKIPAVSIYEDIILLNLSSRKEAYSHLQNIEYFQRIEPRPLKSEEVSRMMGAK